MHKIRLVAEATPRPKTWASLLFFDYAESYWFAYRITIWNDGDEPVGENNVQKIEVIWNFRGDQRTRRVFRFPRKIVPGAWETVGENDLLRVKAPGHAWAVIRLWILPGSHEPSVMDDNRNPVIVPVEGEWHFDTEDKQKYFIKTLEREADDFCSFWSASQTEVKQTLLVLIAVLALILNVVITFLRR